ncbi:MAG TPA: hypothetical protein VFG38_12240 [Pseudomonadales bacterium]|nr:hypothetical protein [Pseudomonadales bacterium]
MGLAPPWVLSIGPFAGLRFEPAANLNGFAGAGQMYPCSPSGFAAIVEASFIYSACHGVLRRLFARRVCFRAARAAP